MKAKELVEILSKHPDKEIHISCSTYNEYDGYSTEEFDISEVYDVEGCYIIDLVNLIDI